MKSRSGFGLFLLTLVKMHICCLSRVWCQGRSLSPSARAGVHIGMKRDQVLRKCLWFCCFLSGSSRLDGPAGPALLSQLGPCPSHLFAHVGHPNPCRVGWQQDPAGCGYRACPPGAWSPGWGWDSHQNTKPSTVCPGKREVADFRVN